MGGVYPIGNKVTTVTLAGYSWDLYVGPNGSMKVFSFIPSDGSWKFSFNADLKLFFNYLAQNQGYPINNQYLIGKSFDPSIPRTSTDDTAQSSSRVLSRSRVAQPSTRCPATAPVSTNKQLRSRDYRRPRVGVMIDGCIDAGLMALGMRK
jgi:hypothetical protein